MAASKKSAKKASKPKSRIVSAVGTASSSKDDGLSQRIEEAMANAVKAAMDDGITDPAEIKERMLAAREEAKAG
jgi:hypothetical protein